MKKFTEDEKVIARNINKRFKWIARNDSGSLNIYTRKPIKGERAWTVDRIDEYGSFAGFDYMFKSIKWEDKEPTLIKDIYNPQILDGVEREYLKSFLKPFHDDVECVVKFGADLIGENTYDREYLFIALRDGSFTFPDFVSGKMYSGMELDKKYKLEELGITYTEEK